MTETRRYINHCTASQLSPPQTKREALSSPLSVRSADVLGMRLFSFVYLQDYIAGRSIIDAHFGRHHHHVILSDVEARRAQAVSAKQKFKKVFCISHHLCAAR